MKIINVSIIFILYFVLLSCTYDKEKSAKKAFDELIEQPASVKSVIESNIQSDASTNKAAETNIKNTSTENLKDYRGKKIDIDLTVMPPMLVYGEVFNMVENPHKYIGKIVKLEGYYTSFTDVFTEENYFFVSIEDALACCAQGVEFIFDHERSYPDDYPENGSFIELVGEFDIYEYQGYTFFYIKTDKVIVL